MLSPKIECIVAQHPWLENDCLYADIILPTNTTLEVNDIMLNLRDGDSFQTVVNMRKAIEPIGESKSDYEAVCAVAEKLGMLDQVTDGFSEAELIKGVFDGMRFDKIVSWEEFQEKDYFVVPYETDWQKHTAGWYDVLQGPGGQPAAHAHRQAGVLLARASATPSPPTRSARPSPSGSRRASPTTSASPASRARAYPLLVMSNHGRWRVHAQCDDIPWTKEAVTGKVRGWDGYLYEPCWMHPSEAEARGIKNGDIVKVYNERGGVLCGALVWERIMPGVLSIDHGARADFIIPQRLDRGGAINCIAPEGLTSKHAAGQATSGYLAEVERVSMGQMEEWRRDYPKPSPGTTTRLPACTSTRWVEGGEVVMAKKVFVIDMAKCNGCHNCQIVCKDEHVANDWTPIAKPQPEIGQFWLELTERVRGTVPKVKVAYRPHLCMHCDDAPCIEACPVEGALYKRDDGLVIIDPVKCTGCRSCVDACPYEASSTSTRTSTSPRSAPGCAHLLDDGWSRAPLRRCLPDPRHPAHG